MINININIILNINRFKVIILIYQYISYLEINYTNPYILISNNNLSIYTRI